MKTGEIWALTHPITGNKTGWRVESIDPIRNFAWLRPVKGNCPAGGFFLSSEGVPSDERGASSPHWRLIEAAP